MQKDGEVNDAFLVSLFPLLSSHYFEGSEVSGNGFLIYSENQPSGVYSLAIHLLKASQELQLLQIIPCILG